jgi:hypothetical protein
MKRTGSRTSLLEVIAIGDNHPALRYAVQMIVLLDRSVAAGAVIGKAISTHLDHLLAQQASEDFKRFAYTIGLRPQLSVVVTKTDVGAGDPISMGDLVDEAAPKPKASVYIRKPLESDDFSREYL